MAAILKFMWNVQRGRHGCAHDHSLSVNGHFGGRLEKRAGTGDCPDNDDWIASVRGGGFFNAGPKLPAARAAAQKFITDNIESLIDLKKTVTQRPRSHVGPLDFLDGLDAGEPQGSFLDALEGAASGFEWLDAL